MIGTPIATSTPHEDLGGSKLGIEQGAPDTLYGLRVRRESMLNE